MTIKINFTVQYVTEATHLSALLIVNFIKMAGSYNPRIKKAWGGSLEDI